MGLSSILKKVVHSKSPSQSSSNGDATGRKSLDSSSHGSRTQHQQQQPRKSLDARHRDHNVVDINHANQPSSPRSPVGTTSARPVSSGQPAAGFEVPQHAPPPPPKDSAPPQLRTPEFKPFSVSSESPRSKDANRASGLPFESKGTEPAAGSDVTFEGHPFPSTTLAPPKTIEAAPRSLLPGHPVPTEPTGSINPSYLSYTESVFSPKEYTPAQHLAYHVRLLPQTTFVPRHTTITPSTVSHEQQRHALADKIQRDHHPKKTPLGPKGIELFAKAGMTVHDPEGKGTIDWTEEWLEAVVHEHVIPHEHREYRTVINREIHRYHIYPVIQPIFDDSPPLPTEELHYFRDPSGQWREVRGRAAAEEIIRLSGAEKTDQTMSWVDKSAVIRERAEIEGLVRRKDEADKTERVRRELERLGLGDRKDVREGERKDNGAGASVGVGKGRMVGDERENDGKAKVIRGVAF